MAAQNPQNNHACLYVLDMMPVSLWSYATLLCEITFYSGSCNDDHIFIHSYAYFPNIDSVVSHPITV